MTATPGESEVGDLDYAVLADQTISSGQISVDESSGFEVDHCRTDLVRHIEQVGCVVQKSVTISTQETEQRS